MNVSPHQSLSLPLGLRTVSTSLPCLQPRTATEHKERKMYGAPLIPAIYGIRHYLQLCKCASRLSALQRFLNERVLPLYLLPKHVSRYHLPPPTLDVPVARFERLMWLRARCSSAAVGIYTRQSCEGRGIRYTTVK